MELEESKSVRNGQLDLLLDTLNSIKIRPHGEASAAIFLLFFFLPQQAESVPTVWLWLPYFYMMPLPQLQLHSVNDSIF